MGCPQGTPLGPERMQDAAGDRAEQGCGLSWRGASGRSVGQVWGMKSATELFHLETCGSPFCTPCHPAIGSGSLGMGVTFLSSVLPV